MKTDEILHRSVEVREIREAAREVDFIASDESIDSHGTIIRQNWRLDRWTKNAPILWAHDNRSMVIGQASGTKVVKKRLIVTVKFAGADVNPFAEQCFQAVKQEFIRAGSVGFYPHKVGFEDIDGREVTILDDNELLEFSLLPIGSNENALALLRTRAIAEAKAERDANKTTAADHPPAGTPAVERGAQEKNMDPKDQEIAALKNKLEGRDAAVEEARKAIDTERKAVETERTAKVALERELDKARAELTAANERAAKAETAIVERDVKALVGDKITAAEVEEMTELAKTNRALFDRIIAKRSPLGLKDGASKLPADEESAKRPPAGDSNDHERGFNDFMKSLD